MAAEILQQQTKEWLDFRLGRVGASDAPTILGTSPYKTIWELWMEKTRQDIPRITRANNFAISRGNKWEDPVRSLYELETGYDSPPDIIVHPEYDFIMASLDGFDKSANVILEIKCAGKEVMDMAKAGEVHEKYYPQVQQQLMCSGASENHFYVADIQKKGSTEYINDAVLVKVLPDIKFQENLLSEILKFWDMVKQRIAPPITEKDFKMLCDDQETVLLFSRIKDAHKKLSSLKEKQDVLVDKIQDIHDKVEAVEAELSDLKQLAIRHAEDVVKHPKLHAVGLSMVKYQRKGWRFFINYEEICK